MRVANRATLGDVAKLAGVSKMAVSVVLNGARSGTRVSVATRERIVSAAAELDYQVNPIARSLRTKETGLVGFYSGNHSLETRSLYLLEISIGIRTGCEKVDKDLLMFGMFEGKTTHQVHQALTDGRVDGVVIHAAPDDPLVDLIRRSHLRAVAHTDAVEGIPSVVVDDDKGGRLQAQHVRAKGHTRVLYRTSYYDFVSVRRREAAFLDEAAKLGIEVVIGRKTTHDENHLLETWEIALLRSQKCTAIVSWDDSVLQIVLPQLEALGMNCPGDFGAMGFNGISPIYPVKRTVDSITCPWQQVAETAVTKLQALLLGEKPRDETVLPVRLSPGGTL